MTHMWHRKMIAKASFMLCLAAWGTVSYSGLASEPIELESETLKVTILPSSSGRVSSLYDKRTHIEHLEPLVEKDLAFSPLVPAMLESNQAGIKDWFWQARISPKIPFRVVDQGRNENEQWVLLAGTVNGIDVQRKIILPHSEPVLLFEITLMADKNTTVSYWAHSLAKANLYLADDGQSGWIAGNFSTDNTPRQERGIVQLEKSGPQLFATHISDYAFNPQEPWIARVLSDRSGGVMLVTDSTFSADAGGFYYTWQNASTASLEVVWPPIELKVSEPVTLRYLFRPFQMDTQGVKAIDEVAKNTHQHFYRN